MSDSWLRHQMGGFERGGHHTTAAICLRGHVATADVQNHEAQVTKFCRKCGAAIITMCQHCRTAIHGHFVPPGASGVGGTLGVVPAYCHECGKPYPWTEEKLTAAKDLADEVEELSAEDRAKVKSALDEIAAPGPRSEV